MIRLGLRGEFGFVWYWGRRDGGHGWLLRQFRGGSSAETYHEVGMESEIGSGEVSEGMRVTDFGEL